MMETTPKVTRQGEIIFTGYKLRVDHSVRSTALRSVSVYNNKVFSNGLSEMVEWFNNHPPPTIFFVDEL